jgi:hypothetical protein
VDVLEDDERLTDGNAVVVLWMRTGSFLWTGLEEGRTCCRGPPRCTRNGAMEALEVEREPHSHGERGSVTSPAT